VIPRLAFVAIVLAVACAVTRWRSYRDFMTRRRIRDRLRNL
jgi:hypothetical protein